MKFLFYNHIVALVPLCTVSPKVPEFVGVYLTELQLF
jgi:hypothetical protein